MKNKNTIKRWLLFSFAFLAYLVPIKCYSQQAGILDSTFGINGVVNIDSNFQYVPYTIIDAQNRVITLYRDSNNISRLNRYLIDGSVDASFGNNGQITLNTDSAQFELLLFQNDEKILIAGGIQHWPDTISTNQTDLFISRFHPDGSLDSAFGNQGRVILDLGQNEFITGLSMQMDSLILILGHTGWLNWGIGNANVALLRLRPDGVVDSSFALNGVGIVDLTSVGYDQDLSNKILVRPDDKIIVSAHNGPGISWLGYFALVLFNAGGSLDSSFGNNGIVIDTLTSFNPYPDLQLENDMSILVAGGEGSAFGGGYYLKLNKYTPGGSIDTTFGINGSYESIQDMGAMHFNSLVIQSDHKIVATGDMKDSLVIMRFAPQGHSDSTFATQGMVLNQFDLYNCSGNVVCLLPNDKITVVGSGTDQSNNSKVFIARYNNDISNSIQHETIADQKFVIVYPNPATNFITIALESICTSVDVTITDVTGKFVYKTTTMNSERVEVNTGDFVDGMFIVHVRTGDFVETKKVVVTK